MGNANSGPKREKPFLQALDMELKSRGKDHKSLRSMASKLIDRAEEGEGWAITEIANRLDGKPTQQVEASVDANLTVQIVRLADDPAPSK